MPSTKDFIQIILWSTFWRALFLPALLSSSQMLFLFTATNPGSFLLSSSQL